MSDLIDREALLKELEKLFYKRDKEMRLTGNRNVVVTWNDAIYYIKIAPLAQKKGKWIKNKNGTWSCSLCHSWIPDEQHHYAKYCLHCGAELITPLCPWRGADMKGEE